MHSRQDRAGEGERPPRTPVRRSPDRDDPGSSPSAGPTAARLLDLQRSAGNLAATRFVQRVAEGGEPPDRLDQTRARTALTRSLIGANESGFVADHRIREALRARVKNGPLFSDSELSAIRRCDPQWLDTVEVGGYDAARAYYAAEDYSGWLHQGAGKRLLVATIAWDTHGTPGQPEKVRRSPAYVLGRSLRLRHPAGLSAEERERVTTEQNTQISDAFVRTLVPNAPLPGSKPSHADRVKRSQEVLGRIFLLMQNGLKVYNKEQGAHVDYIEGDVARALAHGGRVTVRIPQLKARDENKFALPEWVGVMEPGGSGKDVNPKERRLYGTHDQKIGKNRADGTLGAFEEQGGTLIGARNIVKQLLDKAHLSPDGSRLYGLNLALGGWGEMHHEGDVIKPDGAHGHLFIHFKPPGLDHDGDMQFGLETTKPWGENAIGYKHDMFSSEKTANPESSAYGMKHDKIGEGALADNQRLIDLRDFDSGDVGWQDYLRQVANYWRDLMAEAARSEAEVRDLMRRLVGPRTGEFRPPWLAEDED
ncbi:hypothetical protein [Saccharothrix coeruleofusca]|uniref:Novel toxin 11 domain-containing protein n=1 Tax=Saccharothrix coeruleofusca TaxID=33919 RepID=A0A918ASB7_9PSEU|nr:hypothetical protein [Saccharothrix coeruleofusca]GGP76719.1 hypothetical protein GCM10010185_58100 [Saccharothrix coeruleofusca]